MPDGDVIPGLRRLYHQPYQEVVEGKATDYECSRSLLAALKRDIQQKGDPPIRLAQELGRCLNDTISQVGMISAVDQAKLSSKFEQIAQRSACPYISGELVLRAGRTILCELRYGDSVDINNLPKAMIKQYMNEVLDANFIHALPLGGNNPNVDSVTLQQRILNMKSQVLPAFELWADKANSDSSVGKIRMPKHQQLSGIDLDEDLLVGFA